MINKRLTQDSIRRLGQTLAGFMTPAELAEAAGISAEHAARILAGRTAPSIHALCAATRLGVSITLWPEGVEAAELAEVEVGVE